MYFKKFLTALFVLFPLTKIWAPERIDSLESQIALLSKRNELYDNFYGSLEGLHGMYEYHLTWFSVILTVLAGFSIVFQFVATTRENNALRDLKNTFIESSHSQQSNNKGIK